MRSDAQAEVAVYPEAIESWYAIYTRHQHEKTIAGMLMSKGFEVFLPLYSAVHRWKDRSKTVSLPLFPCYVFLRGGMDRRFHVISTPGVCSFVGTRDCAAPIPQPEIDAVRRAVETRLQVEPYPFLKSGDWVRVTAGPLAGIEGVLVRRQSHCRLVLSVELLQRSVAVEIGTEAVERITTRRPAAGVGWAPRRVPVWA
jgi:transcription antitermination factor NusG